MVGDVPGLNGYVTVTTSPYGNQVVDPSVSDALGAMLLQIPGVGSRDLEDVVVERHGSEDWIRFGSTLYRPEDAVPELATGPNSVTFAAEGYAEWRMLASAASVQIDAGTAWRLYDADLKVLDGGTTYPATTTAPSAGCYLLLFGPVGSSATVTVAPATARPVGTSRAATHYPEYIPRLR
jgi:hypothetical protein